MNLILLGSPGAGKGTQAEPLAEKSGLTHIATGDLFRANAREGTELGALAKTYMDRGELVPDEVTIAMLLKRIEEPDTAKGVIFDGFPRNLAQAEALDTALAARDKKVDLVIFIEISDEEAVRRLSGRWLCRSCGAVYNQNSDPPQVAGVCDKCGKSELYQRDDDKSEVVRTRLEQQKPPADMVDYYKLQGKLEFVDGELPQERVTEALLKAMEAGTWPSR